MNRFMGAAALIVLITGCARSLEQDTFLVPGAYDVNRVESGPGEWELSYKVELEYPKEAIQDGTMQKLSAQGWKPCTSRDPDWGSFPDDSRGRSKVIHQRARYWAKEDHLLMIAFHYYSAQTTPQGQQAKPDNSVQNVFVRVMDDKAEKAKAMNLSCERD